MLCIGFRKEFHTKIVHTEGEGGRTGAMAPQTGSEGHGFVSMLVQVLDELLEGNDTGLFQAIYAFANFEVDVTILFNNEFWILVEDLLGSHGCEDAQILVVLKRGAKVEAFNVKRHVSGTSSFGIEDGAIYMDFGVNHSNNGISGIVGEIKLVATSSYAHTVFLSLVGTDVTNMVDIRGSVPFGNM